jgi:histidinol-phosphate phosphatase family protein
MPVRGIFLDRDGVINENRSDYIKNWEEFTFLPGALDALHALAETDFCIVIVTNQSAIHRGHVSQEIVEEIHRRMVKQIQKHGGRVDAILYCPHRPDENCACRKPRPGLLLEAAMRYSIDLSRSYLIGDNLSDVAAGQAIGSECVLVQKATRRAAEPNVASEDEYHVAADLKEAVQYILVKERLA